jgi:hypothetical protein
MDFGEFPPILPNFSKFLLFFTNRQFWRESAFIGEIIEATRGPYAPF